MNIIAQLIAILFISFGHTNKNYIIYITIITNNCSCFIRFFIQPLHYRQPFLKIVAYQSYTFWYQGINVDNVPCNFNEIKP